MANNHVELQHLTVHCAPSSNQAWWHWPDGGLTTSSIVAIYQWQKFKLCCWSSQASSIIAAWVVTTSQVSINPIFQHSHNNLKWRDFVWNHCWLVNHTGKPAGFLPIDEAQEHNIKEIKVLSWHLNLTHPILTTYISDQLLHWRIQHWLGLFKKTLSCNTCYQCCCISCWEGIPDVNMR